MRNRLALLAAVSPIVLALALSPCSRAQQEKNRDSGVGNQNPAAARQNTDVSGTTETIRGVIAGITAEGEVMFDHQNNRAVATEAAFLTLVGSPTKANTADANRPAAGAVDERGSSNRKRHNVYIVWLTPKTKICEAMAQPEKSGAAGETQNADQKREVALDNLEVGDHVEIQFTRRDDSGSTGSAHQTEQMRRKHGRHRTHVGFASEITIMPSKDAASHGAEGETKPKTESR